MSKDNAAKGGAVDEIDVTGWGVWKGHAIPVAVARHIAAKINERIAATPAPSDPTGGDVADDEESAEDTWRRLALQFDAHRIEALSMLKAASARLWQSGDSAPGVAQEIDEFLKAPPPSGEQVLAERIAALASLDRPKGSADIKPCAVFCNKTGVFEWLHDDSLPPGPSDSLLYRHPSEYKTSSADAALREALENPTPEMLAAFHNGFRLQLSIRHKARFKQQLSPAEERSAEEAGLLAMLKLALSRSAASTHSPTSVEPARYRYEAVERYSGWVVLCHFADNEPYVAMSASGGVTRDAQKRQCEIAAKALNEAQK